MIRIEHQRFVALVAGLVEISALEEPPRFVEERGDLLGAPALQRLPVGLKSL